MIKDTQYWITRWKKSKNFEMEQDRIKPKFYLFAPFPKTNQYGFQDAQIRSLIAIDVLSKYRRMAGYNVLFPIGYDSLGLSAFMENKKHSNTINDDLARLFQRQIYELGISIDEQKEINLRHDSYLSSLQLAFIELYERGYIRYENTTVFQDRKTKKIFDSYFQKPSFEQTVVPAFYLDLNPIKDDLIVKINQLPVDSSTKEQLFQILEPQKSLTVPFSVTNHLMLEITLKYPEWLGGVTYICLHPDYPDFSSYIVYDEYPAVEAYLSDEGKDSFGVFSGNYAISPLTGKKIPIFISTEYREWIHLGNPAYSAIDRTIAEQEGLPIMEVIENNVLINSDFLNGLSIEQARTKIIDVFQEAEMATVQTYYAKDRILLSSSDAFGALLPFLKDENEQLYTLKNHLPFQLSSSFRPVLKEDIAIPGNPLKGSINHIFSSGMIPFLALLYDDIGANSSIFSDEATQLFTNWQGISFLAISESEIMESLFFPLVIHTILEKENQVVLPPYCRHLQWVGDVFDEHALKMNRANHNLFDMDRILNEYKADAIRVYFLHAPLDQNFLFQEEELASTAHLLKDIESFFHKDFVEDNNSIDYVLFELWKDLTTRLQQNEITTYATTLFNFYKQVLWQQQITLSQAKLFLKLLYPLAPFLSEDLYAFLCGGKYLISDEGWNL